jgi:hypothetical protein
MDRLKFDEMKTSKKRPQKIKFYFEFEYRFHRTIKRDTNG